LNIILTGSNGFLGTALTKKLAESSFNIRHMLRRLSAESPDNSFEIGDICGETDFRVALNDMEVVIHVAARAHLSKDQAIDPLAEYRAVNTAGSESLARQAAEAGVKRFIFISSIGVNGLNSISPFSESDEESPHDPYTTSKYEAEVILKKIGNETGMEVIIIRPPLIYGGNAPGNFGRLIRLLSINIPLPFGSVNNRRSMIYLNNLVDFIIRCIDHPKAANQIFLISDGDDISLKSFITIIRQALGKPAWLLPVPVGLFELMGMLTGKKGLVDRLIGDLQVDSSKAMKLLDWKPPYTIEQGVKATVDSFLEGSK
jgi:UDP-glucose 4-epimerase